MKKNCKKMNFINGLSAKISLDFFGIGVLRMPAGGCGRLISRCFPLRPPRFPNGFRGGDDGYPEFGRELSGIIRDAVVDVGDLL